MTDIIKSEDGKDIGFYLTDNRLILKVPKFITDIPNEKDKIIKEFFKYHNIFNKYRKDDKDQKSVKFDEYDNELAFGVEKENLYSLSIFELYFTLLKDYKENGLLLFREKSTNLKSKGRIDWKKTLNTQSEIMTKDSIIYNRVYYSNLNFTHNHPVTLIHACCIMRLEILLNIKLGLTYNYKDLKIIENSKRKIEAIIKKYRREMFSDRERKIFNVIESIFSYDKIIHQNMKKGSEINYARDFNYIWEAMLRVGLADEYKSFNAKIPSGGYRLRNFNSDNSDYEEILFRGLDPRPDILVERNYSDGNSNEDYLFVLDAKNYVIDFKNKKGTPRTPDIVKQIFYRHFMSNLYNKDSKYKVENIINAFLLPAELKNEKIRYIGKHSMELGNSFEIEDILCFYIDFESLTDNYLNHNNDYSREILDYIYKEFKNSIKK